MSEIMKVIPIGEAGEHLYHRDDDTEVAGLNLNRLLCLLFEEIPTRMADGLETTKWGDWYANRHNYWSFDDLNAFFASRPYKFNPPRPAPDIQAKSNTQPESTPKKEKKITLYVAAIFAEIERLGWDSIDCRKRGPGKKGSHGLLRENPPNGMKPGDVDEAWSLFLRDWRTQGRIVLE